MNNTTTLGRIPWIVVFCAFALMYMGLMGIDRGDQLAGGSEYFPRQAVWIVLALPAMVAATWLPYRRYRDLSYPLFGVSLVLLLLVYLMPGVNGAHRWIPLGWIKFQPSELAKIAYIMSLAHYLMYRKNYRRLSGLLAPFVLTLIPVGLILREPDLGTSLLFLPVLFAMLFAAGAKFRHLTFIILLGVAVLPLLWVGMSAEQKSRIVTLFQQRDGGRAPSGDGYHLHQSKRVLVEGGLLGSRYSDAPSNNSNDYHLPAARTDFVFCLVGERWGFTGCAVAMILYLTLFARGLMIAAATREPFGRLLAVGIVALLAAQTLINTGMTVGLMPITGMTLPLMSYGGSSLLATCIALGLLINVGMRPGYEIGPEPFRFSAE